MGEGQFLFLPLPAALSKVICKLFKTNAPYMRAYNPMLRNDSDNHITYVIGHYNTSVSIIELVSHTTFVMVGPTV